MPVKLSNRVDQCVDIFNFLTKLYKRAKMTIAIAYLGPTGTYTETATLTYESWLSKTTGETCSLLPRSSIAKVLQAVADQEAQLAVVPVENSIQGGVAVTIDTLWQLDQLQIQQALVLPICHGLLSKSSSLEAIKTVYSHPQALAQCQGWLERFLPEVNLVATNSTTEALEHLLEELTAAAIASTRAAQLYKIPILASNINDYPDNSTRFWVLGLKPTKSGSCVSLAFSVPANVPGTLLKPLQTFAVRGINLTRIESRPTKRSLGEYVFFIDIESNGDHSQLEEALEELAEHTDVLKIFGCYDVLTIFN